MSDQAHATEIPQASATHSVVADVSREMVGIYARFYGRGPTKAKTVFHGDLIVTVLENIFTKAEQVLVGAGKFSQVRSHRQAFQDEVEPLFREAVERTTGRGVRAFLSQVSEEGIAAEVFVLEPVSDPAD
jgi:uncharacterized protein YbcI